MKKNSKKVKVYAYKSKMEYFSYQCLLKRVGKYKGIQKHQGKYFHFHQNIFNLWVSTYTYGLLHKAKEVWSHC